MDSSVLLLLGIIVITLLLILTAFVIAVYSGLLYNIKIGTGKPPVSKLTVAYKFGRGAYKNMGHMFTEACSLCPRLRCFGIYYDDPDKVLEDKLRYAVGSVIAEGDEKPDPSVVKTYEENEYKMITLPEVSRVVYTKFPYTTPLSIMIAVYRLYSAFHHYIVEKKLDAHPWVEIYHDSTICLIAPLERQQDFYVPEAVAADIPADEIRDNPCESPVEAS